MSLILFPMPAGPTVQKLSGGYVLTLSGELDAFDAPELRKSFQAVVADGPTVIVLDLSRVTFLDSTVLGVVVGLLRRVREGGGELRVVLPETTARRIFEITGLVDALDLWPNRESAAEGPG